jgi:FlaG/FlaF family flagellin (archaellin)
MPFLPYLFIREKGCSLSISLFKGRIEMRHIMKHIRRNVKAISPVLAVLMMIAVAIAGSLVVYAWVMGYIGLSTERSGQAIMIQNIANDDDDLLVYVQNVGEGMVQIDETSSLYINSILVNCTITGVTVSDGLATLNQGDTATLTYLDGAALPGQKVTAKVTTLLGTSAEKVDYPAGSAKLAPALHHFEFDPISTPQTVNFAFTITITAKDQYGDTFADYDGVNTLSASGVTISPTATGAFSNGVWNGPVSVTEANPDVTLNTAAQLELSKTGTSNSFEVV